VAERIAHERVEQVGQSAGYHIRLEVKKGPGTRLLLMTTGALCTHTKKGLAANAFVCVVGVLLRMLQMEGNLDGISHIFVDEVRCCFR
jgi:HrpA-like RNA helicase